MPPPHLGHLHSVHGSNKRKKVMEVGDSKLVEVMESGESGTWAVGMDTIRLGGSLRQHILADGVL